MTTRALTMGVLAACLAALPAASLERAAVPIHQRGDTPDQTWAAGATCTISYYNFCTGWVWVWRSWDPGDKVGFVIEACCSGPTTLTATHLYAWSGAPVAWGYTGVLSLHADDGNGCPGTTLASIPFRPARGSSEILWDIPASSDLVLMYTNADTPWSPHAWVSDHPSAGPTGPAACGVCYPATRRTHSFYYGNFVTSLCPGSPVADEVCESEWMFWDAAFACPASVEEMSWGKIRSLYR